MRPRVLYSFLNSSWCHLSELECKRMCEGVDGSRPAPQCGGASSPPEGLWSAPISEFVPFFTRSDASQRALLSIGKNDVRPDVLILPDPLRVRVKCCERAAHKTYTCRCHCLLKLRYFKCQTGHCVASRPLYHFTVATWHFPTLQPSYKPFFFAFASHLLVLHFYYL